MTNADVRDRVEHTFAWTLPAPPDRVFAALTDPQELAVWFAEHVDVEPKAGGAFRFWGKHTYGVRDRTAATQTLTRFEPEKALAFTWPIDGVATTVELALAPGDDGETKVEGRHAFAGPAPFARPAELVSDLWRIHEGNLKARLTGEDAITRPDFDDPSPVVRASIVVAAPRATVFRALMEPEKLAKWMWAEAAVVEPKVGGRYSYGWNYKIDGRDVAGGPTRILEFVENEKLVTDWPDWRGDETVPDQTVTWLLEDVDGGTRVTVVHAGFVRPADISDYPFGWAGFLNQLGELLAE